MAYVEAAQEDGQDVDAFAPRLSFFFNSHNDLFEEIAKFRAARKIWAMVMRDRFGAKKARSWWMRFHTQTAGCSLTEQQPQNNIVRVTIQALAAVLGGTQSLHTNSYDEAWALPTEHAVRIALRTQQIIAHESGVTNTIDPLAGSYYVEWLTNEMVEGAFNYFDKIESLGGVVAGIEKGFFQKEIADAAYRYQKETDENRRIIVGVNDYCTDEPEEILFLKVEEKVARRQLKRLTSTRKKRDEKRARRALDALRRAADTEGKNMLYPIVDAVQAYATLGEMCDTLRDIWGEYEEPPVY
jgi:methylmalonyl-CoA mutase N-terminal domain/subunit